MSSNVQFMIQGHFQIHFHPSAGHEYQENKKKVRTLLVRMLSYRMAEPAQQFSLRVFDNFSKVYVSIEDFAVKRMYVDRIGYFSCFD